MRAEQLRAISNALVEDMEGGGIAAAWRTLTAAVANQLQTPNPSSVAQIIAARDDLRKKLDGSLAQTMPSAWRDVIEQIGVEYYTADNLISISDRLAEDNQISLQDQLKNIEKIQNLLDGDVKAFKQLDAAFSWMQIEEDELEENEAELLATIPRRIFENDLLGLSDELSETDRMLRHFTEAVLEEVPSKIEVRSFGTSDPKFWVVVAPAVLLAVLKAIEKMLDCYKKILDIRKMKLQLSQTGVQPSFLASFDEQAKLLAEKAVNDALKFMKEKYLSKHKDKARANELENALTLDLRSLAVKTDHGYRIDGRLGQKKSESTDESAEINHGDLSKGPQDALSSAEMEELRGLLQKSRQFQPVGDPVLSLPKTKTDRGGARKATKKN